MQWARAALQHMLDFPPPFGRTSKPVYACPLGLFVPPRRSSSLPLTLSSGSSLYILRTALGNIPSLPTPSLAGLLSPLGSDSAPRARRRLLSSHREYILLDQWQIPRAPPPAIVIFRNLESGVRAWLRRSNPCVSDFRFRTLLESCLPPFSVVAPFILLSGMCSTLSAHRSSHPIWLCDRSFLSTRHVWSLFVSYYIRFRVFYYAPRIERPLSVRKPLHRIVKYPLFN